MAMKAVPTPAKNVRVFRNGDFNYAGRKFVVNSRYSRNFDAFLSQVTSGLRPQFGAVRNLYTPENGTRINRLEQLQSGGEYVAGGSERFRASTLVRIHGKAKQIGYRDITADRHTQNEQSKVTKRPIVVVSARLYKFEKMPTTIHVFRNGDELFKGVKFVLSKRDLHNWDQLLTLIGDKIQLRTGAARKLYTLDGQLVSQVTNGGSYVAVGSDKFKKLSYCAESFYMVGPSSRRVVQTSKKQSLLQNQSKQPVALQLHIERTVREESPLIQRTVVKKTVIKQKPKAMRTTIEIEKPSHLAVLSSIEGTPAPVDNHQQNIKDIPSTSSSLRLSDAKDQTLEIRATSTASSVDNLLNKDVEGDNELDVSERSEQQAETVKESKDIQIERTVDMMEAHEVGEEKETKNETLEMKEVDNKQEDEVANQETDSKVGSATSANQRPASWSGGSQKQKSRSSSKVSTSSHHGDDQTVEMVSEHPVGEDLEVNQSGNILDETKIPDDSEGADVPRSDSQIDNVEKAENVGNVSEIPDVANANDGRDEEYDGPESERDGVTED